MHSSTKIPLWPFIFLKPLLPHTSLFQILTPRKGGMRRANTQGEGNGCCSPTLGQFTLDIYLNFAHGFVRLSLN